MEKKKVQVGSDQETAQRQKEIPTHEEWKKCILVEMFS